MAFQPTGVISPVAVMGIEPIPQSKCLSRKPKHLIEVEQELSRAFLKDDLLFLEAVHAASQRICESDAFYICIIDRPTGRLKFVYNFEGEVFDFPESLPIGEGPTSWVAMHGEALHVQGSSHPEFDYTHFGLRERVTHTQLHLPCFNSKEELVAVLSVQWYESKAIKDDQSLGFWWLSSRLGFYLSLRSEESERRHAEARRQENLRWSDRAKNNASWCSNLEALCRDAERRGARELPASSVISAVRLLMTEAVMSPSGPVLDDDLSGRLDALTERERDVLILAAEGFTNLQIAESLIIGVETVKHHMSNALKKMGFERRQCAVRLADKILQAVGGRRNRSSNMSI